MLKYGKAREINQSITTSSVCVLSQIYPIPCFPPKISQSELKQP